MNITEFPSQVAMDAGQFASMGNPITTDRMARSCVELLNRHLGLTAEQTARALDMEPELVKMLGQHADSVPVVVPSRCMPRIERLCAIQSMLLSCYSVASMVKWFHAALPGRTDTPISLISNDNENGLARVLQAAIGRASH